jgi:hypothetical protein
MRRSADESTVPAEQADDRAVPFGVDAGVEDSRLGEADVVVVGGEQFRGVGHTHTLSSRGNR